ncbi:CheR family methyltransferase [Nocardioides rubriscoriae]|uniref:CheR family methyltransferase n=1 Tax=Nocardioides rubriscoriae TaxID=642762 RepID=UPI001B883937|nr:protein-glutamate O-methyltransferase CheR [Nocardioides rubriscoriae]
MISPSSFGFVADFLLRETAMVCEPGKEYLVEARLLPLARAAGVADVDRYVDLLRTDAVERGRAADALTINETSWFRDLAPYQAFTDVLLPQLLAARQDRRHLEIWSAACSSGQEAYSIAMLLDESLPPGWTYRIHATDVSPTMLERVRAGRYSQVEMNRGMPANRLVKYFTRVGREWEVSADLRRTITTEKINLAAPLPGIGLYDFVLLRNVLIYFDVDVKRDILRRFRARVAPDGFLMLGSTETTLDLDDTWIREAAGRAWVHRPRQPAGVRPATGTATATSPATPSTSHPTRLTTTGA